MIALCATSTMASARAQTGVEPAAVDANVASSQSVTQQNAPHSPPGRQGQPPSSSPGRRGQQPTSSPGRRGQQPTSVALPDRLPFLARGWRPIATAGYRLQLGRQPFDRVDVVDVRVAHGLTVGVLLPLLASGTAGSRIRVAFALGAGADVAVARYEPTYPYRDDEGRRRYQVPAYAERTTYLHGQVAAILRARLGARVAVTTTLAWLPGARLVRIGGADVPRPITSGFYGGTPVLLATREWTRSFERARLGVGVQVGALHAGVFFGATSRDGLFFGRRQELDLGAQLGAGW